MNDNDIYSIDFTRSLPPVLKDDPKMIALARTIAEQLQVTARQIEKTSYTPGLMNWTNRRLTFSPMIFTSIGTTIPTR